MSDFSGFNSQMFGFLHKPKCKLSFPFYFANINSLHFILPGDVTQIPLGCVGQKRQEEDRMYSIPATNKHYDSHGLYGFWVQGGVGEGKGRIMVLLNWECKPLLGHIKDWEKASSHSTCTHSH